MSEFPAHYYRLGTAEHRSDDIPEVTERHRAKIEPWLSAIFQSEHFSALFGNGLTLAVAGVAGVAATKMETKPLGTDFDEAILRRATVIAERAQRGTPNVEDQFQAALVLLAGLEIEASEKYKQLEEALGKKFLEFYQSVFETEVRIRKAIEGSEPTGFLAKTLLLSFLLSFASRAPSRERLHIFTTNYDRLIEFAAEDAGIRILDRFIGSLTPLFRSSRLDVDFHYNPPGIRGEPRYLEGVVRLTKLHGSLDWVSERQSIRRVGIRFGEDRPHPEMSADPLRSVMIYPNSSKDVETTAYPYADLFRDFSNAICRPNSALVTYGYSFGDDHVNRVIADMLTISSTHLVVISRSKCEGRLERFLAKAGHPAQISLLLGQHFGDFKVLAEHYLPKPSIDPITMRRAILEERRGTPRESRLSGNGATPPDEAAAGDDGGGVLGATAGGNEP